MRLYVALSLLEEEEWSNGTGCTACADTIELCLRRCLRNEQPFDNHLFAGHVSLYFEDADDSMVRKNGPFAKPDAVSSRNFSMDVLERGRHSVNLVQSGACGWYGRWSYAVVKLYEVEDVTDDEIRRVHSEFIDLMSYRYTSIPNMVALMPWAPWALCCFLATFRRCANCVGAVEIALQRGLGRSLGLTRRLVQGARLPAELVQQLEQSGFVNYTKEIVLVNRKSDRERECVTGATGLVTLPLLALMR